MCIYIINMYIYISCGPCSENKPTNTQDMLNQLCFVWVNPGRLHKTTNLDPTNSQAHVCFFHNFHSRLEVLAMRCFTFVLTEPWWSALLHSANGSIQVCMIEMQRRKHNQKRIQNLFAKEIEVPKKKDQMTKCEILRAEHHRTRASSVCHLRGYAMKAAETFIGLKSRCLSLEPQTKHEKHIERSKRKTTCDFEI